MKKKLCIGMVAILMLILGLCPMNRSSAEEPLTVDIEGTKAQENELYIYLKQTMLEEQYRNQTNYTVTLGGESLPVTEITNAVDSQEPSSYMFLVDVSGSMSEEAIGRMREILTSFVEEKRPEDNICIVALGNDTYSGNFIADSSQLMTQIQSIQRLQEDTNLYYGIYHALDILKSSSSCNQRRNLVVLSDGMDDQVKGITKAEVENKIETSNVPIYTVAMLEEGASSKRIEQGKVLGSFARMSPGGDHITYISNEMTSDQVASTLINDSRQGAILKTDLTNADWQDGQLYLQVNVDINNVATAYDTYEFPSTSLVRSNSQNVEENQAAVSNNVQQDKSNISQTQKIYIILAIVALVGVLIYLVSLFFRHKIVKEQAAEDDTSVDMNQMDATQNDEEDLILSQQSLEQQVEEMMEEESDENTIIEEESVEVPQEELVEEEQVVEDESVTRESNEIGLVGVEPYCMVPRAQLTLTSIGLTEETVYEFTIQGEITVGRNREKCEFSIPEDALLSGVHCSLQYTGSTLIITDLNSTNGTFVNGVPIVQSYDLQQDDTIMIGSKEYRVNYKKK